MAPRTVTPIRRNPHVTVSKSSTKAHENVSRVEITSPEGRSVCHRWLRETRWSYPFVIALPKARIVAPHSIQPARRQRMVEAASTTPYAMSRGPKVWPRLAWRGRSATLVRRAAKTSGPATAWARVPAVMRPQASTSWRR